MNAAGILRAGHTHTFPLDKWNQIITVNLTGTFLMTRAALPRFWKTGNGVVINFSSPRRASPTRTWRPTRPARARSTPSPTRSPSNTAVRACARSRRPGSISSGIVDDTPNQVPGTPTGKLFGKLMPIIGEGMAHPDVIAGMIAALASDDGKFVTGTSLRIDGGTHA